MLTIWDISVNASRHPAIRTLLFPQHLSPKERNSKERRSKMQQWQLNSEGTLLVLTCSKTTFKKKKSIVKNSRKSWPSISKQDTFPTFPAFWHSHPKPLTSSEYSNLTGSSYNMRAGSPNFVALPTASEFPK